MKRLLDHNGVVAGLFLVPAFLFLITFTYWPALAAIWSSFHSTPRGRREAVFIGVDNYRKLLADDVFWQVMSNTAVYALLTIIPSIVLAILMALWVNRKVPGVAFLRLAFFTPTMLPLIAVANLWLFFYTPGFGLFDQVLTALGLPTQTWLGQSSTALIAMSVITVWKEAGLFMIFYLAALQTMSPTLREAADIEGASSWQFFWRVTFPLLMPTTLFVSVNALINSFRLIDHIIFITQGGPNHASTVLLYYIYETAFSFWDTAYAATLTVVMLGLLLVLGLGQVALFDRRIHYK
ncbi:MAG: carbohydrate ABC transporter permease [Paracoccaceae bacterium]